MSYSVCIACHEMVGCYQKYCSECVRMHGLPQDELFQKTHFLNRAEMESEFTKDMAERGDK